MVLPNIRHKNVEEKLYECENCKSRNDKNEKICGNCKHKIDEYPTQCLYVGCKILVGGEWRNSCRLHECLVENCEEFRLDSQPFCWFHKCKIQNCNEPSLEVGNLCKEHKL